jgi:hypothetical protein
MATWTRDELRKVEAAEELELASVRRDGTLGEAVTIWVVRVDDDLYVRSWKGHNGAWFRGTQVRHQGHIAAGGVEKDVAFVMESDNDINDRIDVAYRTKYCATADATSTPWWPLRPEPQRSTSCRAQRPGSSTGRRELRFTDSAISTGTGTTVSVPFPGNASSFTATPARVNKIMRRARRTAVVFPRADGRGRKSIRRNWLKS